MDLFVKQLSIFLLGLLLNSCVTNYERDLNDFNYLNYYLNTQEFQYKVTESVKTVDSLPKKTFIVGESWEYNCKPEYSIDPYTQERLSVSAVSDSNTVIFRYILDASSDNYGSHNHASYTVQISGGGYTAIQTVDWSGKPVWDSAKVITELPIPHISQLNLDYKTLYIVMDDKSICYTVNNTLYSTKYGKIKDYHQTLVKYNEHLNKSIPRALNEYYEKRDIWFQ